VIAKLHDTATRERSAPHARSQAAAIWNAYKRNQLREMYYWPKGDQSGGAVLVYEADTVDDVQALIQTLPMAQAGLVDFDVYVLEPYANLEVLFASQNTSTMDS
jgi:hypothetical protein